MELRDGQSFAIAGLMDNMSQDDTAAIPLLSRLPIIGHLFKSQGRTIRADRADGPDYAAAGAAAESGRSSAAADEVQGIRARGRRRQGHAGTRTRGCAGR